ncbi:MAG: S1 RNA-binding domain-containing protein, partial [Lutimaribacter sp.]
PAALSGLHPEQFVDDHFGLPTVRDIFAELEKPGRDPRPGFKTAAFADGVEDIKDLKPGMMLEGTVTNVAAFGAFVDVGVHQDGLVHVSQLADKFVKDPHEVVKAGDIVRVRVTEVDIARKRIGLSMRKEGGAQAHGAGGARGPKDRPAQTKANPKQSGPRGGAAGPRTPDAGGALGAALRDAMKGR